MANWLSYLTRLCLVTFLGNGELARLGASSSAIIEDYRIFIAMVAELLMSAAQREITVLDEKLYLQVFAPPETQTARRASGTR